VAATCSSIRISCLLLFLLFLVFLLFLLLFLLFRFSVDPRPNLGTGGRTVKAWRQRCGQRCGQRCS
jgi:hypothetical protein